MIKKIKILHIINNLKIGGAERMLVTLLNSLADMGIFEIHLISLEHGDDLKSFLSKKIIHKEFGYDVFGPKIIGKLYISFRFGLYDYVKKIKPDIIHGHLLRSEDFAKILGALLKKPVIVTLHDKIYKPNFFTIFLNNYLSKMVVVSEAVSLFAKKIYKLPDEKIMVIPNAINIDEYLESGKDFNRDEPVFIYIGRLLKSKGIEDAIVGLSKLVTYYPKMKFLIYGKEVSDGYGEYLKQMTKANRYSFVKFMGNTMDVPGALKKGDIFILPSQSEGFAISVLEAAAASKPIIATDTGVIAEVVKCDRSGELVEWNSPNQIYNAAKKIIDNDLVKDYGKQARIDVIKKYSLNDVVKKYKNLYRSFL